MGRNELVSLLADIILNIACDHPLRVAIDGVDAAGKTCLAEELARFLEAEHTRQIIQASVDGFHNPRAIRRRQGSLSPEGFYRDSYNYPILIRSLLAPLGPGGNRRFRTAAFDYRRDAPLPAELRQAQEDAILLMDGIFLLRPELRQHWDLSIFLQADFEQTLPRGAVRDAGLFGSRAAAEERYQKRYIPGQKLYLREARPLDKADIVIDNNTIHKPRLIKISPTIAQENTQFSGT